MKKHQKLLSCFMIAAFCASGMLLGGCKRTKEYRTEVTTGAAVSTLMMTNPLGSLYGNTGLDEATSAAPEAALDSASADLIGCPAIDIGLQVTVAPLNFKGTIDLAYNDNCIVHGLAMSGAVSSEWSFTGDIFSGIRLQSSVTFDNLTMEGKKTNGSINQLLATDENHIPYAEITGTLTTEHYDGRTQSIVYENLIATVDLGNFTEFQTIFPGITITDNNTAALVINGSATYTNEDNMVCAMTFTNVKQPFGCTMPNTGIVHIVNNKKGLDAIIDYGDGTTCDTLITVTLKGEEPQEIDVVEWMKTH